MKYLKLFESFLRQDDYSLIKKIAGRGDNNTIILVKTQKTFDNKLLVKSILPEEGALYSTVVFYIYTDEIAENTYEDEYNRQWELLYSSKDLEQAKEQYNMYTSAIKYNL